MSVREEDWRRARQTRKLERNCGLGSLDSLPQPADTFALLMWVPGSDHANQRRAPRPPRSLRSISCHQ